MPLTLASNAITFTDNTVLSSGVITAAQLSAGAIQQSFGNTSGAFSFRNKIINGSFDIWQRGTSGFTNLVNGYCADRWAYNYNTTDTVTFSRQIFTPGQTDVPGEPTYFIRATITGGNTEGVNDFRQRVEGVRTLAGKTVTLSYWIRGSTPATLSGNRARVIQFFGSGGSPSSAVETSFNTAIAITTSWQKIVRTVTLPSITGKTIGTDGNDYIDVILGLPIRTTMTVDIAQVQLEEGPVATPFEQRPIGTELSLCQRYYHRTTIGPGWNPLATVANVVATGAAFGTNTHFWVQFPVTMRTTPIADFSAASTFQHHVFGVNNGPMSTLSIDGDCRTTNGVRIAGS
jgi:hypothetical protein